jgi:Domain of unknown function (DUF4159)
MRTPIIALMTAILLMAPVAQTPAADPPKEPLVEQVDRAIKKGKDYLIVQQTREGDWEKDGIASSRPGGCTALTLLALLNAGVEPNDPVIKKGLDYLDKKVPPRYTYVVALQTMAYCLAGEDKQRIEKNVQWLIEARRMDGNKLLGWTYDKTATRPDASNTQYAVLGLHEAQLAGVEIKREVWDSIRDYYLNTQLSNGTSAGAYGYVWDWTNNGLTRGEDGPRFTMTTAGLCGLLIAGADLNAGRETPNGDGTWKNCGNYVENDKVVRSLEWLGKHFPAGGRLASEQYVYYSLYGIERAGRLTGMRYLGGHDWYRVGCEFLVGQQVGDGSWRGLGESGGSITSTSFALLFLSKGRTPILISKLTHEGVGQFDGLPIRLKATGPRTDWNNDRNDARHLVEFAGRELFNRKPMGWQVFNSAEADSSRSADDLAAELLQSPIAYFNGHLAPDFSDKEKDMLKTFTSNGGLIFAEACCGSKQFDDGFRKLMKDKHLFPDQELLELDGSHPVWTASGKFPISPRERSRFPLYGIQSGCKTVVIYSPNDLSCRWESNQNADKGDNELAFRIGANVIAYATGLEPPKPRLTHMEVAPDGSSEPKVPRGFLKVGLVKHEGDFNAAAQAMPNLMLELRTKSGLDVSLKSEEVLPTKADVANYKFLYMHGRKNFTIAADKLGDLRFSLEHGGLLFADACCGSKTFDESFRKFIGNVWPDGKYKLEPIPVTDELYGKDLNGKAIKTVLCRHETADKRDTRYQEYEPSLEGVKVRGRWAVIYSKYDIGCALEKHKSPGCLGHDYDSAVLLGRAVVLYHLR